MQYLDDYKQSALSDSYEDVDDWCSPLGYRDNKFVGYVRRSGIYDHRKYDRIRIEHTNWYLCAVGRYDTGRIIFWNTLHWNHRKYGFKH